MTLKLNPEVRRQAHLFSALVVLLASVYMLTYSGRIESGDTLLLVDAVGSVVNQGDTLLDLSVAQRPPLPQLITPGARWPLPDVNAETLQLALAAPLYWAAQRLPGVGLVHAVYLFNVLVCALAGGVMFLYGRALGYSERTAALAGLGLGLATIVWPYSKSFFQEPLALLLLLTAALLLELRRAAGRWALPLLAGAALAFIGAVLSKNAAALALPTLLVIALPARGGGRAQMARYALLLVALGAALLVIAQAFGLFARLERLLAALASPHTYTITALHGYLLSVGGSIWGTSPALLLALPGVWLLARRGRWRYPLALALALGGFTLIYALRQGPDWFGGLSWPPRFIVPVVPFALLCALPALERLVAGPAARWARAGALLLVVYSLWVQLAGVSLWWGEYSAALPLLFVVSAWGGLRTIYVDPLYQGDREPLRALLPLLEAAAAPDAVALLSDPEYMPFFLNYARFASPRLVALPHQPGEQPSPEQPPVVTSDNPDFLVEQNTGPLIHALAETRDDLWLVASSGPFLPWAVRPVERFMAAHYFPLAEQQTAPDARLIAYSAASAPDPFAFRGPEYVSDARFGGALRLAGFDLPRGTVYAPGAALPVSLYWQAEKPVAQDYTVAWFLRDSTGWEAQQGMDSQPGAGFMPTSAWQPGAPVRDNRALRLPAGLVPGAYQVWVVVYGLDAAGAPANLPADGGDTREGYIGVLPVTITIAPSG